MNTENRQDPLAKVETERRDFLKKIAISAAFAAPTIATFSLDGMRKKAFAQATYDAPQVLGLTHPDRNQAVVTFSQPMDTGVGGDLSRVAANCRQIWFTGGDTPPDPTVTWSGNTHQVINLPECLYAYLNITYNQSGCGGVKFRGANGLELVPYSGAILINNPC